MHARPEGPVAGHSVALDALRAYPALIVLIAHLYAGVFNSDATPDGLVINAAYWTARSVNAAVVVLIVLSGYIVGGAVIRAARAKDDWRFDIYALNRLTRLWNVLIPALVLTYLVDCAGIALFGDAHAYGGDLAGIVFYRVSDYLTGLAFLGNAFFVGTIHTPSFGTNGALWTVQYEFWFYFLGAALLFTLGRLRRLPPKSVLLGGAAFVVLLACARGTVARYFTFWLLGALASMVPLARLKTQTGAVRAALLAIGTALVLVGLGLGARWGYRDYDVRLFTAVCTSLAMPLLVGCEGNAGPGRFSRMTVWLASISFSLYAIHVPLVVFYAGWLGEHGGSWSLSNTSAIAMVIPAVILVGIARVFAQFTEYRLGGLRRAARAAAGRLAA